MKEKEDKSKKLEDKVNGLIEKVEKEENPLKRLGYTIKCKMLVTKLERQISLEKAKGEFKKQKEENKITAKEEKVAARSRIIRLNKNIKQLEYEIRKGSSYDVLSQDFIFPTKEVEKSGGIKSYVKELNSSGIAEQQEAAKKIQENIERRKKLKILKEQLAEQQEQLNNSDDVLKNKNSKITREEMALTVKSKFNIFGGIRNLANSVTSSVKEFFTEFKENREADKEKLKRFDTLQQAYIDKQEEIRKEYEARMQKLDEKYGEIHKKIGEEHKEKIKEKNKSRRTQQSHDFQERLKNMAKESPEHNKSDAKEEDNLEKERAKDVSEIIDSEDIEEEK